MKKLISVLLVVMMLMAVAAGCGKKDDSSDPASTGKNDVKIGFIFLHDENSTYDKNFMDAAKAVQKKLGLSDSQVIFKSNIPESNDCYEAAADLADAGCDLVFADSFGHEDYMIQAAKEYPDVEFCHATGVKAKTEKLKNYHNAFAAIYEGRYLAGVAAGMKLKEMIDNGTITAEQAKMGYVGAYPYAEVISGLTSYYLGAKSVCDSVTMDVKYTNSWFDISKEKEAAQALITGGAVLISQHADSEGAPKACEEAGVPNVSYNISTISIAPNTALISSKISWEPYMEMIIKAVMDGGSIPVDYCATTEEGAVLLTELNETIAAPGTKEAIEDAKAKLASGEIHVFDVSTFTLEGKPLETGYKADVISDPNYEADTEVVFDGYFHESEMRSAPYFYMQIDGITGVIPES